MLTDLGKQLRKLRIDSGERLLDMANRLGISASFVSAVEVGRKSPPAGFEEAVIRAYRLGEPLARSLRSAADGARKAFVVEPATALGRDTAGLFARRINSLSSEQLEEIQKILYRGTDSHERK